MNASAAGSELKLTTPSDTEIRMEREFEAPPELVWRAWTEPELFARWIGPHEQKIVSIEMDVRVGGRWSFASRGPDGVEHRFGGEFRLVEPPRRIEQTFKYEPVDAVSIDRLELEPLEGGRCRMVSTSTFESREHRDGMLRSGMEHGVREVYEKLEALLEELAQG